jgi:protein-tyrosine phosphatase
MLVKRILFVCLGNICRSPSAEGVLRAMAAKRGIELVVDSAGTAAYHAGECPDKRSIKAAAARGYALAEIRARQVVSEDFARFDLIFAMDQHNFTQLMGLCPAPFKHKVALFLAEYGSQNLTDVPDPYYGQNDGFEYVLDLLEDACDRFLTDISPCYR